MALLEHENRKILEKIIEEIMKKNNINLKESATLLFSSKAYEEFVNKNINVINYKSLLDSILLEDNLINSPIENNTMSIFDIDAYSYIAIIDAHSDFYSIPAKDVIELYNKYDILNLLNERFDCLEGEYHTAQCMHDVISYKKNKN